MKPFLGCAGLLLVAASLGVLPLAAQTAEPPPPAEAAPAPLTGQEAWAALLGNTISGITADGTYSEYYQPDGTAIHVDGDGREPGQWMRKGAAICFTFPSDPDEHAECRQVEVDGSHGAFITSDGSRYPFEIQPGNPKKL